jgi:Arc/MetJ-type ribon-helix-helix transcriptional regulator
MRAQPAQEAEKELLDEIRRWLVKLRELETRTPGSGLRLLASAEAEGSTSSALEALFALNVLQGLNAERPGGVAGEPDDTVGQRRARVEPAGTARKVSVSMPEDLTSAVQRRVGPGKFSQYVTEAVTRQLELDLLAELSELLASEHGPVPANYLAEARAAWPDDE